MITEAAKTGDLVIMHFAGKKEDHTVFRTSKDQEDKSTAPYQGEDDP